MEIEYEFDEVKYLKENPDVEKAVEDAKFSDGSTHFEHFGHKEGRVPNPKGVKFQFNLDSAYIDKHGFFVAYGWIDDFRRVISHVTFQIGFKRIKVPIDQLLRFYRKDVSEHLGDQDMLIEHGFIFFLKMPSKIAAHDTIQMTVSNTYTVNKWEQPLESCDTRQLINNTLGIIQQASTPGSLLENIERFSNRYGDQFDQAWKRVVDSDSSCITTTIGAEDENPSFSVITVLYGKHDLIAPQSVLLLRELQANDAEIIICNNSPWISSSLDRQARILNKAYGIRLKLISLANNVGFSKANNVGAEAARSERLLFLNPDVFPIPGTGIEQLLNSVMSVGEKELIGGALFYGDDHLMHAGMAIVRDEFPAGPLQKESMDTRHLLRVDHYLKGAPPELLGKITESTPVQAVTGALMVVQKAYFNALGGFSEEYVFGHYEDADLCLRVWQDGGQVLLDPEIQLYHFEGSGSGQTHPYFQSAQHLNRVRFTRKWLESHENIASKAENIQRLVTEDPGARINE